MTGTISECEWLAVLGLSQLTTKRNEGTYLKDSFTARQNPRRIIKMLDQLLYVYYLKATCLANQGNKSLQNYWGHWFLHFLDFSMVLLSTYTCIIEINPTISDTHEQKKYTKQNRKNCRVNRIGTRSVKIADEPCQLSKNCL